jgi:hypothetical protein
MVSNIRAGNPVEAWVFGVIEPVDGLILALEWNELTDKSTAPVAPVVDG